MRRRSKISAVIFGLLLLCVGAWLGLGMANLVFFKPLNDYTRDTMAGIGLPITNHGQERIDRLLATLKFNQTNNLAPEVVATVLEPSVVQIIRHSGFGGQASGVIVDEDGTILTNYHVVAEDAEVSVKISDGRNFKARVLGGDSRTDLAVIRLIPANEPGGKIQNLVAAKLGDSDKMLKAEKVLAFGAPYGLSQTVTEGIISAKERTNVGIADYEDFLQTDAAINPGNSGGPLVNLRGEVIGINTAIVSRTGAYTGVGFAIPINMARDIMKKLIEHGEVVRGYFGIKIAEVSGRGALVRNVTPGSPAAKAGLAENDLIVEYDGTPLDSMAQFRNYVAMAEIGSTVTLKYYRGKKKMTADVVIEREPPIGVFEDSKLGITVRDLNYAEQRKSPAGVAITNISDDSILKSRIVDVGSIIVRVYDMGRKETHAIRNVSDYEKAVKLMKQGDSWRLTVLTRSGYRILTIEVP